MFPAVDQKPLADEAIDMGEEAVVKSDVNKVPVQLPSKK